MGKMNELSRLLEEEDEIGLQAFFGKMGWREGVARLGGEQFMKAHKQIQTDKKRKTKKNE